MINTIFIIFITLGILMIALVHFVGFSSRSERDSIEGDVAGVGHGKSVKKGDIIYVEYEVDKEGVDVFLITGYYMPFGNDGENVLISRPNSTSGSMTYEVTEDDMHMVYFKGKNFNYSYSFRVDRPLFSAVITISGLALVCIGLLAMWHIPRIPNPRYMGNSVKYLSMAFGFVGVGMLFIVMTNPIDDFFTYLFPLYMIIFGVEFIYLGKFYNKQYMIRCPDEQGECTARIDKILDHEGIDYKKRSPAKENRKKWDTIFDFEGTDTKIKIRKLYFQQDKTLILLGKKNPINGSQLSQLANDIAKDLGCRNYKPVSD
jgi:hypothetical protein